MKNEKTLLDLVSRRLGCRNDAALARRLELAPPVISKIRNARLPIGPTLLLRLHDETGMGIREIKSYITHGPMSPGYDRNRNEVAA